MRKSIQIFAKAMEVKLQRDDQTKGPWEDVSLRSDKLTNGLRGEVSELMDALFKLHHPQMGDNHDEMVFNVRLECCDVALYAMMIYSNLHPESRNLIRGRDPGPTPFTHGDPDGMPSDRVIMKGRM